MKHPVRFTTTSIALCYDSKNDRVIKIVISVDDQGREWERYDGGGYLLLQPPEEPDEP